MDILKLKITDKPIARDIAHWSIFISYVAVFGAKIIEMTVYMHYNSLFIVV